MVTAKIKTLRSMLPRPTPASKSLLICPTYKMFNSWTIWKKIIVKMVGVDDLQASQRHYK